ncbi:MULTISPECIES: SfnB family sulfur acquisition oxidoreductase [unclassified Variovorax]|jgi:SfnB family sulfur acquisition oxidoreductase|uniref:SfnB family sulfur acquisition oxidoreductase n=1 Tax=unclassified Variovorax TaxID=663243 RepID=UPI00086F76AB|nr:MULTISPECIES: SfnB family sulfur acquisition oxidoreductase [unclassified Variovorax]MBN8755564.1 SfnB family sulfur acquisition oxidoreductase [Variovorax sp.]ODU19128.1 MAG: SfnB family sulfur acquisition oxidoreductase [Variovorax sp. SCN 67-85]ODV23439.1 MAG: SfnB family sulfur acquisition oxidoreductase [Variovorax sp. SCN 67-20]OJZ16074.1 MAG: SfnB family sulfur acquisition oxidoreductase [Variovorax sp. 67-131]
MSAVLASVSKRRAGHRTARAVQAAQVLRGDADALDTAHRIARLLADGAALRDRDRILPAQELDVVSGAGLWAMNVPRVHGGAGVSYVTVAQVFAILSAADASIGQIQQNHNSAVFWLSTVGTAAQKEFFLGEILRGCRFGNANVDAAGKQGAQPTVIARTARGHVLSGEKVYATGALFAHYVTVIGQNEAGDKTVAIIPAGTPGLTIEDDWNSFGQRTTASGRVRLDRVELPELCVLPIHRAYSEQAMGAVSQLSHVGIDLGIAQAALDDTVRFLRSGASITQPEGALRAVTDPLVISQVGEIQVRLHAAAAMTQRAGLAVDAAVAVPDKARRAAASLAVAEAKWLTSEVALFASSKLFELCGTRSAQHPHAFDRHWRNARVHTLHDPVRHKLTVVGDALLNGVAPEGAGAL